MIGANDTGKLPSFECKGDVCVVTAIDGFERDVRNDLHEVQAARHRAIYKVHQRGPSERIVGLKTGRETVGGNAGKEVIDWWSIRFLGLLGWWCFPILLESVLNVVTDCHLV